MATTLQQSEEALRSQDFWATGALPSFETIKVEEDGSFGGIFAGSVCGVLEDGKAKALLISSLSVRKVEGEHIIPGYGRVTSSFIAENLNAKKRSLQASLVAAHDLPESCRKHFAQDDILSVRKIDLPEVFQPQSTRIDYRTEACPEGQSGHIVKMVRTVHSKGNVEYQLDETATQNLCRDEKNLNGLAAGDENLQGIALSGVSASSSKIASALASAFAGKKCRAVKVTDESDKPDEKTGRFAKRGGRDANVAPAPGGGGDASKGFDTCSPETEITPIAPLRDVEVRLERVETSTAPCGGTSGTFYDTFLGRGGLVTHSAWAGNATYQREIYRHRAVNAEQRNKVREFREKWIGDDLKCRRDEALHITCNSAYPKRTEKLVDKRGYHYTRENRINGWASAADLIANEPSNPKWVLDQKRSGCIWRENTTWGCSEGSVGQTQEGRANRTIARDTIGPSSDWERSEWNIKQPAICEDRRTRKIDCPAGTIGDGGDFAIQREKRTFTRSHPEDKGSWSKWNVTKKGECKPANKDCPAAVIKICESESGFCQNIVNAAPHGKRTAVYDHTPGEDKGGGRIVICDNGTWTSTSFGRIVEIDWYPICEMGSEEILREKIIGQSDGEGANDLIFSCIKRRCTTGGWETITYTKRNNC